MMLIINLMSLRDPVGGCYLAWVNYVPTCSCGVCSVGVVLLRSHFADDARVTDVSSLVEGGVFVSDDFEGVRFLHALFFHALVFFSNALAKAPELVCIGDDVSLYFG